MGLRVPESLGKIIRKMARLGTGLPSNLYSGGAVSLDESPFVNYYLQTQQRQQAQDDAMYKYFGDLNKNLSPTGMHSNDIPALMEKKNAWQQYAIDHKKEIARPSLDKGKAYQQYMGMYNDMQGHIAESREKVKALNGVASVYKDPAKRALLTEKTLTDIANGEKPINDPTYQRIDPTALNYNPKPFGLQEQGQLTALLGKYKGNESIDSITPIPGTNQERVKYKTQFTPDQLNGLKSVGTSLYHNNPSFKQLVDQEADPLSNNYAPLNEIFKQHYGRDIQSPEDMATAHVLSIHPNKTGRESIRNKTVNPLDLIKAREDSNLRQFFAKQGYKESKANELGDAVNKDYDSLMAEAEKHPRPIYKKDGTTEISYSIPVTEETKKMFAYKDEKGHLVYPEEIRVNQDKKAITPIYYKGTATPGGTVAIDEENSKPVSSDEFKLKRAKQLFGQKANIKAVMNGSTTQQPTSKPAKDPLKLF